MHSNFSINGHRFIKYNNNSTIKSIKDKIRRFIKKKVDILERFVSTIEQRRIYLKQLCHIREGRVFVNDTTICGLNIQEIPNIYFFSIKEGHKNFAFDIRELYQIIMEKNNCNPYTKIPIQTWLKTYILKYIGNSNIFNECFYYSVFGDTIDNVSYVDLFNKYCIYRESNEEFVHYIGDIHNDLVLAFYGGKEKEFKFQLAFITLSIPDNIRNKFVSFLVSF
jgi:hypothetical protein